MEIFMGNSNGGISALESLSINSVSSVIKRTLGTDFVYSSEYSTARNIKLCRAVRHEEEFIALYSPVLCELFIPDGKGTQDSKLSTLFQRNLDYVNRHGLVGAKKMLSRLLSPEIFDKEARHVRDSLIHYSARVRALGTYEYNAETVDNDESRRVHFGVAYKEIRRALAGELYREFVPQMTFEESPYNEIYLCCKEAGYFDEEEISDTHIEHFLALLLMLALNLYGEDTDEYERFFDIAYAYVKTTDHPMLSPEELIREKLYDEGLGRNELSRLTWWLTNELEDKLSENEKITLDSILSTIRGLDVEAVFLDE